MIPRLLAMGAFAIGYSSATLGETVVVYGATGNIGAKIVTEALDRGHEVVGVSRDASRLTVAHPSFTPAQGDVNDLDSMLATITGTDVVVLSVRGYGPNNLPEETTNNRSSLTFIEAAKRLGESAPRAIHLGGGSTLSRNGVLLLETRDAEEGTQQHGLAWGHWLTLQNYRASENVNWTVITPSGGYIPEGERTGTYRIGGDEVLVNREGRPGRISHLDFAMAVVDEIERGQAVGRRITVGY
ncbi:MAG TPA: NAD(P)H-binding protein [Gammaproteobacteria bacterium]